MTDDNEKSNFLNLSIPEVDDAWQLVKFFRSMDWNIVRSLKAMQALRIVVDLLDKEINGEREDNNEAH